MDEKSLDKDFLITIIINLNLNKNHMRVFFADLICFFYPLLWFGYQHFPETSDCFVSELCRADWWLVVTCVRTKQLKTLLAQVLTVSILSRRFKWSLEIINMTFVKQYFQSSYFFSLCVHVHVCMSPKEERKQWSGLYSVILAKLLWPVDRYGQPSLLLVTGHQSPETLRRLEESERDCYNQLPGQGLAASFNNAGAEQDLR